MINFYRVLEVGPAATGMQIKAAYRRQARKHHPDINSAPAEDATARFRLIAEAYQTLSDSQLRAEYTLQLLEHVRQQRGFLCYACGSINRISRRLPDAKDAVCGVCREVIPLSQEERQRINERAEKPKVNRVVERIKVEARSVAGEMAIAALQAAAKHVARKLR